MDILKLVPFSMVRTFVSDAAFLFYSFSLTEAPKGSASQSNYPNVHLHLRIQPVSKIVVVAAAALSRL